MAIMGKIASIRTSVSLENMKAPGRLRWRRHCSAEGGMVARMVTSRRTDSDYRNRSRAVGGACKMRGEGALVLWRCAWHARTAQAARISEARRMLVSVRTTAATYRCRERLRPGQEGASGIRSERSRGTERKTHSDRNRIPAR